jgi:hypothetical protein
MAHTTFLSCPCAVIMRVSTLLVIATVFAVCGVFVVKAVRDDTSLRGTITEQSDAQVSHSSPCYVPFTLYIVNLSIFLITEWSHNVSYLRRIRQLQICLEYA